MQALLAVMDEVAEFQQMKQSALKQAGMIQVVGSVPSQTTHLMYGLGEDVKHKLIVVSNELKAKQLYEEYRMLDKNVWIYPAKDLLFYHADIKGKILLQERMEVIKNLIEVESSSIIVCYQAFMDKMVSLEYIKEQILNIEVGQILSLEALKEKLVSLGYDREAQIEGVGQFAVRGGIVDIYPLTEEQPVRIEFWDDEVDSIRSFDLESQRSIENLQKMRVYPSTEQAGEGIEQVSFLEYFNKKNTLVYLDEPIHLEESGQLVETEFIKSMENRMEQEKFSNVPQYTLSDIYNTKEIINKLNGFSGVAFTLLDSKCGEFQIRETYHVEGKRVSSYNNSFEMLTRDLKRLKRQGYRVILLSGSRSRAKRLAEDLRDYDLSSYYSDDMDRVVEPGEIMVAYGHVREGYEYSNLKFIVIAESDIFGREKKKKKRKKYEGQKIQNFTELKVGDYVVHENHGLGIYQGIEQIERDKVSKDYMKISYAGTSNLYIPATQMDLIQKYASVDAKKPKLNRLGTQEWHKTKTRVRAAVKEMAKDLVELYAARQKDEGYVYGEDTIWQKEFEEMFPFEETEDQLLAIEAAKRDMESNKIMDRLVCGDVGYGKTEIAIRAAFKAVQESKQVVYLVPTTILAQQHYNNFVQRMKDFPVRIDLMCRFRTPAQQRKTIEDMRKGLVDIVIGTHRLLSKDMEYKDLGLLIVDEEQRFGVQHKEKIKKLKENVDVMTLTATPIPRTLHMSLIGIRDMSVLEEAPQDRMPIQTYVMEYNDEMVREAIERELARDGQVYYVYNKVKDIDELTNRIAKLVPDANVAFAHGQMKEHELERIMYDFINGEIDVLVSTTIIETGLDISNANTMIIHDSDQLGLSQLYQLRGRVGRSNRMAYAFLLYRRDKMLKEVAEKRLSAIREFTDLGSGFKIAMRDLEIRGAGNLLGAEQHGHMEAVGYDMFCKMLNEAVKHLKGEMPEDIYETVLDLNVDAYIPATYIPNEYQKLDIYKRIACIENEEEMDDMLEELIDRFGDVPKKVQQLLQIALLKALAHSAQIVAVEQKGEKIKVVMYEKAHVKAENIPVLIGTYQGSLTFKVEENPYFLYQKRRFNKKEKDENVIETVKKLLIDIKGLID
ncbi:MAG: transcription-repair coupling factor [Eubacteriales bacterium]